jgi:hypothetical protein
LEGKILDYNGEKKGPENFPYIGVKEEILRTQKNMVKKRSAKFPICSSEGGNFADQKKFG